MRLSGLVFHFVNVPPAVEGFDNVALNPYCQGRSEMQEGGHVKLGFFTT